MNALRTLFTGVIAIELIGVLVLQHLLSDHYSAMGVAKYVVNTSIFFVACWLPKPTRTQRQLWASYLLIWIADFFFVLWGTLPGHSPEDAISKIGGMLFFGLAYLNLMAHCARRVQSVRWEVGNLIAVLAVVVPVGLGLWPTLDPGRWVGFLAYFLFMTCMGTLVGGTWGRSGFPPTMRRYLSIAGWLFLLSEMFFGIGMFYPGVHRNTPWLANAIWVTYIPAWTLGLWALSEDRN